MKLIYNRWIPFGNFGLMNVLGLVFTKTPIDKVTKHSKRHEGTHTYQQYELLAIAAIVALILCNIYASWWYLFALPIVPFAIYALAFFAELVRPPYHNAKAFFEGKCLCDKLKAIPAWFAKVWHDAYRDNCFEREAYMNDDNPEYLATRHLFAWVRHIIPNKDRKNA